MLPYFCQLRGLKIGHLATVVDHNCAHAWQARSSGEGSGWYWWKGSVLLPSPSCWNWCRGQYTWPAYWIKLDRWFRPCTSLTSHPFPSEHTLNVNVVAIRTLHWKIRLIEGYAKCRHLKKLTFKGTLRQVFICLRPITSDPPTHYVCVQVYLFTQGREGELNQREC